MCIKIILVVLIGFTVNGEENFSNKSTITYDPEELLSKMFAVNITQPRRIIKFEDNLDSNHVSFDDQNFESHDSTKFKFENDNDFNNPNPDLNDNNGSSNVNFDNMGHHIAENGINNPFNNRLHPNTGKKKRRRRKPKQRLPGQPGFWNPGYPGLNRLVNGNGQNFGPAPGQIPGFGPNRFQPEYNGQFYRPPRRPQPSLASDALATVTGALTSIAHNDDYQCVARLLCEAAAGGALGGSSLLESVSGLQPLLTLVSAYNGISSNPLFIFGRAAFLGMSSKGNSGSCRYAYPQCPTDPEQLVHYLNNHNGGFFRFFNEPQHGQQNLEQFYNQLSQNYGLYQPNPGNNQESYGLLNPGQYQNSLGHPNLYPNGYGNQQNYGFAYPYNYNNNNGNGNRFQNYREFNDNENKIEKRIQNKPANFLNDNSGASSTKWLFPDEDDDIGDETEIGVEYINGDDFEFLDKRRGKTLKFPEADFTNNNDNIQNYNRPINFYSTKNTRTPKEISFPENQKDVSDDTNNYYSPLYSTGNNLLFNNVNKGINNIYKAVNYNHKTYNDYQDEPGVTTVYVVRGNGDPNNPEVVKLRPGETL